MEVKFFDEKPAVVVKDMINDSTYITVNIGSNKVGDKYKVVSVTFLLGTEELTTLSVCNRIDKLGFSDTITMEDIVGVAEFIKDDSALDAMKLILHSKVEIRDSSPSVNVFFMEGWGAMWLNREMRMVVQRRLDAEKSAGKKKTTLWYGEQMFELEIEKAMSMINRLEIYASECYDATQQHLKNINKIETIEQALSYDITSNYPDYLYL
ncbi:MAG: hypothetical protein ACI30I_05055 [Parabacteroides sp.]